MIIINFKNYVHGKAALDLARKIEIYYGKAFIAPPPLDIREVSTGVNLDVFSQHVDFQESGKSTGHILPEVVKEAGACGTLLNHSEHKLSLKDLKKTLARCVAIDLKAVVCVSSIKEAQEVVKMNPYAIAFEDSKLISTGNSITEHNPRALKRFVSLLDGTDIVPLCGAGISKGEDVAHALILGCKGVLIASAVANSPHPEKFLKEIADLF